MRINSKLLEQIITNFKETLLTKYEDSKNDKRATQFKWELNMKDYYRNKADLQNLKFII